MKEYTLLTISMLCIFIGYIQIKIINYKKEIINIVNLEITQKIIYLLLMAFGVVNLIFLFFIKNDYISNIRDVIFILLFFTIIPVAYYYEAHKMKYLDLINTKTNNIEIPKAFYFSTDILLLELTLFFVLFLYVLL